MTSKVDIRIHDSNFEGSKSSSLYYDSERINWVRSGGDTSVTVFTDNFIAPRERASGVTRVGWLLEPPSISPDLHRRAMAVSDDYDLMLTYSRELHECSPEKFAFYPNGMSWIAPSDWRRHEKTQTVSIVASAKRSAPGHHLRHELIESAEKLGMRLDVYGRGYRPVDHKVTALAPYMFSVAIENCSMDWYFSEKLLDCFATHTIPIYYGCPDIGKFFDRAGMFCVQSLDEILSILRDIGNPYVAKERYATMRQAVEANFEAARQYRVAEDWFFDNVLAPRGIVPAAPATVRLAQPVPQQASPSTPYVRHDAMPHMKILVPAYNAAQWIERCLRSIASQQHEDFECLVIDDASTDDTFAVAASMQLDDRFCVVRNPRNVGPLANTWAGFERMGCRRCDPECVLTIVDGDDWLAHDLALAVPARLYAEDPELLMTYGNYANDDSPGTGRCDPFPEHVIRSGGFREHHCVVSCLRTFKAKLWNRLRLEDMVDETTGKFFIAGGDVAYLMPLLEMAGTRHRFVPEIIYYYNTGNPLSDHRIRGWEQHCVDAHVRSLPRYPLFK